MPESRDSSELEALRQELARLRARIPELEGQAEELSRSRRLQSALFRISELTHTVENMPQFYAALHAIIGELMYAENFFIALRSPHDGRLRMEYFRDAEEIEITAKMINDRFDQEQLESTLFAHVIRSGQMLHVDQEETRELARREEIQIYGADSIDWLGVPLKDRNQTFGALVVQSYDDDELFDETDERLLTFVNQHIAAALTRKWDEDRLRAANDELESRVRQRTEELEQEVKYRRRGERLQAALFQIAQLASEPIDMDRFYRSIHRTIKDLIHAPNLYVALHDRDAGVLRYPYIVNDVDGEWSDEPLPDPIDPDTPRPALRVLTSGKPLLFIAGETPLPKEFRGSVPVAWLGLPLKVQHRTIGLVAIESFDRGTRYDEADMDLMTFVARHVAAAILRRDAQAALENAHAELERRVVERTRELQEANTTLRQTLSQLEETQDQLIESEKMASLGNLVAGVAHEINTPLGVAVTAATHLDERCRLLANVDASAAGTDVPKFLGTAREAVKLVLANLTRALELVASFKQVAADQSTEDRRRFNLKAYLEEILTSLRPKFKRQGHRIELICPEDVELDSYPSAIYRIVSNLIMNSTIHGFETGHKGHIRLEIVRAGEAFVHMIYSDDGRGMDEEVRRRIFEPFFTTRRGHGGTGLGMQIVYNHCSQLGGSIRVKSAPGKGVEFFIEMPLVAREQGDAKGHHAA